jgi:hypothetical protein
METDRNHNGSGRNGDSPNGSGTEFHTQFIDSIARQGALRNLPASRPEAVATAKQLIADPNFPSSEQLDGLAALLAVMLTHQNGARLS